MNTIAQQARRRRRPGGKAKQATNYTVRLDRELAAWGKAQPGGLSVLLRRLLQEERARRPAQVPSELTALELLALPVAERRQHMLAQADDAAAEFYQADLALPQEERELTAAVSLDDPIIEPQDYLAARQSETRRDLAGPP